MWSRNLSKLPLLIAVIGVLLAALGALQFAWIDELARFQREQANGTLSSTVDRFAERLDREFEHLWRVFYSSDGEAMTLVATEYALWIETSAAKGLVDRAYRIRPAGDEHTHDARQVSLTIVELDLTDGSETTIGWSAEFDNLRARLIDYNVTHEGGAFHEHDSFTDRLPDGRVAFVVARSGHASADWLVVALDPAALARFIADRVVDDHHLSGTEYELCIVDELNPDEPLYQRPPGACGVTAEPDALASLPSFGGSPRQHGRSAGRTLVARASWTPGALGAAVDRFRTRNLLIGMGVVAVLFAAVATLVVGARRAGALAQRQIEFVAGISHEIRTPIAGISALGQNLADGVVEDAAGVREYGAQIRTHSKRLSRMADGVLRYAALRAGRQHYEMRQIGLRDAVESTLASLGGTDGGVPVDVRIPLEIRTVRADEAALQLILGNLISNALKFSPEGGRVLVRAAHDPGRVRLDVVDQGPGIPPSETERVLEPFVRGEYAHAHQVDGTGLGLSLVKAMVDAHGGALAITSGPDGGTTVSVWFPDPGAAEKGAWSAAATAEVQDGA